MHVTWIRDQLEKRGISQAVLGEAIGLTSVQINKILTGYRRLQSDEADRIRDFLGDEPPISRVENGESGPESARLVPVMDISASAGFGAMVEYEAVAYSLAFPPDYLAKVTRSSPKNLSIISVKGDSMEPSLKDDDIVMVDVSKRNLGYDGMFVVRHMDVLKVKRLRLSPDRSTITLISDNQAYAPEVWPAEEIEVIGRVIWVGGKV